MNTKCKKLKNIINGYDNHQLMDRVIPEISPIQISKCDSVNSDFFKLFHKNVVKYKSLSKNQETIEKLTSEEQLSTLLLIKFNQMKNIQGRIPVKCYQTYLVNNNNIELRYIGDYNFMTNFNW